MSQPRKHLRIHQTRPFNAACPIKLKVNQFTLTDMQRWDKKKNIIKVFKKKRKKTTSSSTLTRYHRFKKKKIERPKFSTKLAYNKPNLSIIGKRKLQNPL